MRYYKNFKDIPKFPHCNYRVDIFWKYLEDHIKGQEDINLDLNPDFQRNHVWTAKQQKDYCEYILMGGRSGRELYFNCKGWNTAEGPYVIVDGKQRLEAVRKFLRNELRVFGNYYKNFKDSLGFDAGFSWNIASLDNRKDVIEWYIGFNTGGTIHTEKEINRVKKLIKKEK